jgi:hypothetical protein
MLNFFRFFKYEIENYITQLEKTYLRILKMCNLLAFTITPYPPPSVFCLGEGFFGPVIRGLSYEKGGGGRGWSRVGG